MTVATQNKALLRSGLDHLVEAASDFDQLITGLDLAGCETGASVERVKAASDSLRKLFTEIRSEFPTHRVPELASVQRTSTL